MINKRELDIIRETLPPTTKLVAVSKFKSPETIMEAYNLGIKDFGENRPQELKVKMESLPVDIRWHFIGNLQSNKIKMIIDNVYLIHSVSSEKLLREIDKEAAKRGLKIDCLLQVYIAREESKQGLTEEELLSIIENSSNYPNVRIRGLMGMASFVDDFEIVSGEFGYIKGLFNKVKNGFSNENNHFDQLSIGMSGDYQIALKYNPTIVRIGSSIFGERQQLTK